MTDTLQVIAENTAYPAMWLTESNAGKVMPHRWRGEDKPAQPEETRTADEIIEHIRKSLREV